MKIIAPKSFPHMTLGFIEKGKEIEVPEKEGKRLVAMGLVKEVTTYETKVIEEKPVKAKKAKAE
jgi:hypothetical protein